MVELDGIGKLKSALGEQVAKVVVGQESALELLLIALLTRGHVLMEGPPGTAKTLLAKAFSATLSLNFGRIQFTPDLMPGDVLGTNLFNFKTSEFELIKGPIFTELLLADEINRTPPKTQAALLEAMSEGAVTIDGDTFSLGAGFMVLATQNPIEQQGTYPLPEAQLDRFLFKILVSHPERDTEREIVMRHGGSLGTPDVLAAGITSVADLATLEQGRRAVSLLHLSEPVVDYIVDLTRATRSHPSLVYGASPRAATMLAASARARAALDGRDYVLPDDVKTLAPNVLRHRVVLAPEAHIDGLTTDDVVQRVIESVEPPK